MNRAPRHAARSLLAAAALALAPVALAPACAASSSVDSEETSDQGTDAIQSSDVIARAMEWVDAKLHYCQSPNHASDAIDPACSAVCERKDDAKWDPYRSDCSGLVSVGVEPPAPGRTTFGFAPFEDDITKEISGKDLEPGDAVNNSDHVMLFKRWIDKGKTAEFIEEPGCSSATPYAHEVRSHVEISGTTVSVDYNGMTFTAIRYKNIKATPAAPAKPKPPTLAQDEGTFAIAELDGNGTTDIDGDGKARRACAFNGTSINCYLSRGDKFAAQPIDGPDLPTDEAAKSEFTSTIRFADINGDGKADICVRESTGVVCWLSDGHGFGEEVIRTPRS